MRPAYLLVVVLALACDRGAKPNKVDCGAASTVVASSKEFAKLTKEQRSDFEAAIKTRCSDDKWNSEVVTCVTKAADENGQRECLYKHLTREQHDKLDKATPSVPGETTAETMAKVRGFKDAMCACKDINCAQRVSDDMTKWAQELAKSHAEPPRMTEEDTKQAAELGEAMGRCMQAAFGAGSLGSGSTGLTADQAMAKMAEFKDQMCACKDAACAQKVSDAMTKWSQEQSKNANPPRMTDAQTKQAESLGYDMGVCMQKAMSKH